MTEPLETRRLDRSPVLSGLEALLRETDFSWSFDLIGEEQAGKLATLTGDLRRGVSATGDGKRITSGFSYLGTQPAIAWANVCRDRLYPVMKQSIESFNLRWRSIRESLGGKPYHYVSLGPGDGQKDAVILRDLRRNNAQLCYVAVDTSTEMLRLGVPRLIRELKFSRSRVLSVQRDFSSRGNAAELRRALDVLFGEEAVLFSLLDNTMTNFENDTELLSMLTEQLLRPQDRFVLEVATTRQLDDTLAQEAAEEYGRSRAFREFITSVLMHYTDLHIDMDSVLFQGSVEEERALLIKVIYQNRTGRDVRITLPDRTDVYFPQQDTVRLGVSRKYMRDHLDSLLAESGVHTLASSHFDFGGGARHGLGFGMALLVLTAETSRPGRTLVKDIWWKGDNTPATWGEVLRQATPAPESIDMVPGTVTEPSVGPEQRLIEADTARLWSLVEELSPRQRTLLQTLFTDNPQPYYAEVARATGIPSDAIGRSRARALQQLRRRLDEFSLGSGVDVAEDVEGKPAEGDRTGSYLLDDLLDKAEQALHEKLEPKVTGLGTGSSQGTGDAQLDDLLHRADEALRVALHDLEFDPSVTTRAGWEEAFARSWAEAIVGTSYVSVGRNGLAKHLLGLTHQLAEAALAAEFDPSVGRRVGVDMVAAHFTGTETLSRTVALVAEGLPGLLGSAPLCVDVGGRVAQLTGSIAAGYAGAMRERSLDEQDAIYRAGLRARRQAEQALAASEAKFRAMFTEAGIGIGIGDLEGNITDANPALQRMFGYTPEEFTHLNLRAMVHPEDAASVWEIYRELIRGERDHFRMEKRFYRSDRSEICIDLTVSLVRNEAGEPAYHVALLEDVSERRRLQAKLEHQAYHDPLTGLANRAMVTDRLAQVFAEPAGRRRLGLCFLDLDGFKVVNDSLGHDVGDQLLIAVASRLTRCCGPGQLVARVGGDEFVIVIEDTAGVHDVVALADEVLAAIAAPIRVGGHELTVTTSIGVVERPVADTNPADLMQAADITLYRAKAEGKARYAMFDQDRKDSEVARFTLSTTMLAAVDCGEFFVDDQPLVWLEDGVLGGVEALVRWRHPTFGVLGPERLLLEPSRPWIGHRPS